MSNVTLTIPLSDAAGQSAQTYADLIQVRIDNDWKLVSSKAQTAPPGEEALLLEFSPPPIG